MHWYSSRIVILCWTNLVALDGFYKKKKPKNPGKKKSENNNNFICAILFLNLWAAKPALSQNRSFCQHHGRSSPYVLHLLAFWPCNFDLKIRIFVKLEKLVILPKQARLIFQILLGIKAVFSSGSSVCSPALAASCELGGGFRVEGRVEATAPPGTSAAPDTCHGGCRSQVPSWGLCGARIAFVMLCEEYLTVSWWPQPSVRVVCSWSFFYWIGAFPRIIFLEIWLISCSAFAVSGWSVV